MYNERFYNNKGFNRLKRKIKNIKRRIKIRRVIHSLIPGIIWSAIITIIWNITKPSSKEEIAVFIFAFFVITSVIESAYASVNNEPIMIGIYSSSENKIISKYETVILKFIYKFENFVNNTNIDLETFCKCTQEIYESIQYMIDGDQEKYVKDFIFKKLITYKEFVSFTLLSEATKEFEENPEYTDMYNAMTSPFIQSVKSKIGWINSAEFRSNINEFKRSNLKEIEQLRYNTEKAYQLWQVRRETEMQSNWEKYLREYSIDVN